MKIHSNIFLLTGEWQDEGNRCILRYYGVSEEHGPIEILFDDQQPVFFITRGAQLPARYTHLRRKPLTLRNFDFLEVDALYFPTQKALLSAAKDLQKNGIPCYEADLRPERRYLMERYINAQAEISGEARQHARLMTVRNPRMKPAIFTPTLKSASLDIEIGVESNRLYSIGVEVRQGKQKHNEKVFMLGDAHPNAPAYLSFYADERSLLKAFLEWWQSADPDVLIGWQVINFDLRFLQQKCRDLGVLFTLGRANRLASLYKQSGGGLHADIPGRVVLDGPASLRRAFYTFEEYSLEFVAQQLLGVGKTITPGQDKIQEIESYFEQDKIKLAEYNLQDCRLVSDIFQTTGLIDLYLKRSQISGLLLNQVGMSVAAFDHFYLPRLHRKGFVAVNTRDVKPEGQAPGGYVMEPAPGIYEHVAVLDFKSLYPSIIRTFCIDPLSRLMASKDPIETPTGFRFSATEHILPAFIGDLMAQRAEAKQQGDSRLSQAIKILMNSFYGVMGSHGCRFYHPDLPAAITSTGQWLLKECRRYLEEKGYQVLYGDTDSLFVQLPTPDDQGANLAELLNDHITEKLAEFRVTSHLEIEYEKLYHKFVLPLARSSSGGARKRYVGLIGDVQNPQLELVGMEYVRSDWTQLAKDFQYELYLRVLTGQPYREWICGMVKQLLKGELDQKLVYHKRLRKPVDEYTRHVSPQVRAARMLGKPVRRVSYLQTVQGATPLELHPTNIDYQHYIDKQLRPVADALLGLLNTSFDEIVYSGQLSLF